VTIVAPMVEGRAPSALPSAPATRGDGAAEAGASAASFRELFAIVERAIAEREASPRDAMGAQVEYEAALPREAADRVPTPREPSELTWGAALAAPVLAPAPAHESTPEPALAPAPVAQSAVEPAPALAARPRHASPQPAAPSLEAIAHEVAAAPLAADGSARAPQSIASSEPPPVHVESRALARADVDAPNASASALPSAPASDAAAAPVPAAPTTSNEAAPTPDALQSAAPRNDAPGASEDRAFEPVADARSTDAPALADPRAELLSTRAHVAAKSELTSGEVAEAAARPARDLATESRPAGTEVESLRDAVVENVPAVASSELGAGGDGARDPRAAARELATAAQGGTPSHETSAALDGAARSAPIASTAAPAADPPVATNSATTLGDLPARVAWLADEGGGVARIRLHPAHLGEVDVRVRLRGSAVEVTVIAAEAATRTALAEQRSALSAALGERALSMDAFDVRDGSSGFDLASDARDPRASHGAAAPVRSLASVRELPASPGAASAYSAPSTPSSGVDLRI